MVAAILLFVFLTPRKIFHDDPVPLNVSDRVYVESETGHQAVYRLRAEVFSRYALQQDNKALIRAIQLELQNNLHHSLKVERFEPVFDDEQNLEGFRVWVQQ